MDSSNPRISVEPRSKELEALVGPILPIVEAVERGGGVIVEPSEAEAIIWLARSGYDLRDVMHDGIRWVQFPSAGVEYWLNSGELDDKRVYTSAAGAYAKSVGEHAVALVLAGARRLAQCARYKDWDRARGEGRPLRGSTVGIIGAGGIGQEVIRLLQPFGVRIIAVTRRGYDVPGADVSIAAAEADHYWNQFDYAIIAAPATPETDSLVGRQELAAMPEDAWIVNVGRGSLVDTDSLVEALQNGEIGGAALDVTDPEPLPSDHPLWTIENVLITPHASNPDRRFVLAEYIKDNVVRFSRDEELVSIVNMEAGY